MGFLDNVLGLNAKAATRSVSVQELAKSLVELDVNSIAGRRDVATPLQEDVQMAKGQVSGQSVAVRFDLNSRFHDGEFSAVV